MCLGTKYDEENPHLWFQLNLNIKVWMGRAKVTRPTWKRSSKFIKRSNIYLGSYIINKMGIFDLNYIQVLGFGWDEQK